MALVDIDWLGVWADLPEKLTAEQLAADLVKVGLEEETIHSSGITGPIVKGKCLSREEFTASNGKQIGYCRVDVGVHNDTETDPEKELVPGSRGIICGAPNLKVGDDVVVVLPGAVLPGDFEIAARKTYGHISNGMICSERELGLGTDHDGIIRLQESHFADTVRNLDYGTDIKDQLGLSDEILEINITPDRGYCFSYRGVAREYALSTNRKFTDHVLYYNQEGNRQATKDTSNCIVKLADDAPINGKPGCTEFVVALVKGIDNTAPTPDWMKTRLTNSGMRSISLPVDVTNYVMLHFGQPLHAYDYAELQLPIIVRRAEPGEQLETLDGKSHDLDTEDLLICDSAGGEGKRSIGIAGVMGGASTEVSDKTTDILLESAYFEPVTISRSARRHKIPSEASKRFERGIDPAMQVGAAYYAASLLVEFGGGTLENIVSTSLSSLRAEGGERGSVALGSSDDTVLDCHVALRAPRNDKKSFDTSVAQRPEGSWQSSVVTFNYDRIRNRIGVDISALSNAQIDEILTSVGCAISETATDSSAKASAESAISTSAESQATIPTWRPDITAEEDLTEEVARIMGYDLIPVRLPVTSRRSSKSLDKTERSSNLRTKVSNQLVSRGFTEILTYPFTPTGSVKIANPLGGDKPYLRETLLQTTIECASLNLRRNNENVRIFEVGKVFQSKPVQGDIPTLLGGEKPSPKDLGQIAKLLPNQPIHICAIDASDTKNDNSWALIINEAIQTLRAMGVSDTVTNNVTIDIVPFANDKEIKAYTQTAFHPFMSADIIINGTIVGRAGRLHPNLITEHKLPTLTTAFEINLDKLARFISGDPVKAKTVETYPIAGEDYSFVVSVDTPAREIKNAIIKGIKQVNPSIIEEVKLFDEFHNASLGTNKSLSFKVVLRTNHTFADDEIKKVRAQILESVAKAGGELRN